MRRTLLGLLFLGACASGNAGLGLDGSGPGGADGAPAADASPFIDAVPPAADADLGPVADSSPCPIYQDRCPDGTCIATSSDPGNCGACGLVCPAGYACQTGACVIGPPPPDGGTGIMCQAPFTPCGLLRTTPPPIR